MSSRIEPFVLCVCAFNCPFFYLCGRCIAWFVHYVQMSELENIARQTDKQTEIDVMMDEHLCNHKCAMICNESCMNSEQFYSNLGDT